MEHLENILSLVSSELKAISDNGKFRSREEIDSVYKLIDIAKDIHCIWEYEDEESEYSEYGREPVSRYKYDGGMSYARGRNAKRDSMGRYSRDYRGYARDGKHEYIEQLRDMMDSAPDEQTRQSIQRMIQQMEK